MRATRADTARLTESESATSSAFRFGPMLFRRSSNAACETELGDGGRTTGSAGDWALRRSARSAMESRAVRVRGAPDRRAVLLVARDAGGVDCLPPDESVAGRAGGGAGGVVTTGAGARATVESGTGAAPLEDVAGGVLKSAAGASSCRLARTATTATTASPVATMSGTPNGCRRPAARFGGG